MHLVFDGGMQAYHPAFTPLQRKRRGSICRVQSGGTSRCIRRTLYRESGWSIRFPMPTETLLAPVLSWIATPWRSTDPILHRMNYLNCPTDLTYVFNAWAVIIWSAHGVSVYKIWKGKIYMYLGTVCTACIPWCGASSMTLPLKYHGRITT